MPSPTFQSSQQNTTLGTGSITITKPTSLAVGDLMIAHLGEFATFAGFNVPSGWASIYQAGNGSNFNVLTSLMYKIADAGDVAASNFTFTSVDGAAKVAGAICRITGFSSGDPIGGFNGIDDYSSGSVSFPAGFTPDGPDTLFLFTATCWRRAPAFSNYAMVTDNPTWAQSYQFTINTGGFDGGMALAYAQRASAAATGNFSMSVGSTTDIEFCGIAINPNSGSIKTIDGLANASVKTVDGLARASVKSINGLE